MGESILKNGHPNAQTIAVLQVHFVFAFKYLQYCNVRYNSICPDDNRDNLQFVLVT